MDGAPRKTEFERLHEPGRGSLLRLSDERMEVLKGQRAMLTRRDAGHPPRVQVTHSNPHVLGSFPPSLGWFERTKFTRSFRSRHG